MRRFATASNAVTLVAETHSHQIAGFIILHLEIHGGQRTGYVVTIDVSPTLTRSGIATQLLTAAERQALHQGAGMIRLHVYTGNQAAVEFYLARGYFHAGSATAFYGPGNDAEIFKKALLIP